MSIFYAQQSVIKSVIICFVIKMIFLNIQFTFLPFNLYNLREKKELKKVEATDFKCWKDVQSLT